MSFWETLLGRGHRTDAAGFGFVDIHCHLLPGVDDGAADVEEALGMLALAYQAGTRRIVATPHLFHPTFPPRTAAEIGERFLRLQKDLEGYVTEPAFRFLGEVTVDLGAEHRVSAELFEALEDRAVLPLAGGRHLLVELDELLAWPMVEAALARVREAGFVPVLAHVERFSVFRTDRRRLAAVREAGALAQVNADALLGRSSRASRQAGRDFLKHGLVDVIASDAHRPGHRPPGDLQRVFAYLRGKGYAVEALSGWLRDTPARILGDAPR